MKMMKLKQIRKSKGYTLSDLSSMVGCTSSYLSQLERGLKQPSLEMLRRICNCLDVPIFDLLSEETAQSAYIRDTSDNKYTIIRQEGRKKITLPEILTEYEFITPYAADGSDHSRVVGMCSTLMPGKWSCEKLVTLETDFTVFIIQGAAIARIEEDTITLGEGDSVYIYSGIQHNFYNTGDRELIMLGFGERNKPGNR